MNDELFAELIASVREGGAILRGEAEPSRTFTPPAPDVKRIREGYKLSQKQFATMLGISAGTLRNWEQGRRAPEGPARVLLRVAERHPKVVWSVVRSAQAPAKSAASVGKSSASASATRKTDSSTSPTRKAGASAARTPAKRTK